MADTRLATFLGLCDYLCVPVMADNMEKGAFIAFLGITLDNIMMEARLLQDKLNKCLTPCEELQKSVPLTGILSLRILVHTLGKLYLPPSLFRDGCVTVMCIASLTPSSNYLDSTSEVLGSLIATNPSRMTLRPSSAVL